MLLGRLYLQTGTFLDYYTGSHDPSISASLRRQLAVREPPAPQEHSSLDNNEHGDNIPANHRHLFPQFCVTPDLPPMFLIHGSADTAVLLAESCNLHRLLQEAGVFSVLEIIEGKEHSFDYDPSAEDEFGGEGGLFDRAIGFLKEQLLT